MTNTRIVVLAMGSRGDVQPFTALAARLQQDGHDVLLVVPRDQAAWAASFGLTTAEFDLDTRAGSQQGPASEWERTGSRGVRHEMRHLGDLARSVAPEIADAVVRHADNADLVISGAMTLAAAGPVCEHRGIRHVLGLLAPVVAARAGASTVFAARPAAHSIANQVSGLTAAVGAYRVFTPVGRAACDQLGIRPDNLARYLRRTVQTPTLLGVSPQVVPLSSDWGAQVRTTGYWTLPRDDRYQPPEALADFLAAGPPPVYVGFGSMVTGDPAAATQTLVSALETVGSRGLISAGWAGLTARDLPETVRVIDDVPHDWLFPQVAAVVHHGGAGTTAAAIHAGRPQVVVPHVGDQFYWGRRVHDLGLGPEPIRRHQLTRETLAGALSQVLSRPAVQAEATALAERVSAEDGVTAAVDLISGLLAGASRP